MNMSMLYSHGCSAIIGSCVTTFYFSYKIEDMIKNNDKIKQMIDKCQIMKDNLNDEHKRVLADHRVMRQRFTELEKKHNLLK